MGMVGDFVIKPVTRITSPVANRTPSLNDKEGRSTDDPVECESIVEPVAGKEYEVVDCHRNITGEEFKNQVSLFCFDGGSVLLACVDRHRWWR